MIENKKQQQEYVDAVKNYTTLDQFGTNIYFSIRDKSIVLIYNQSNNLTITFDLITKEFKQSLYSDLIRINHINGVEVSKLAFYLDKLVQEFREAVMNSAKVVKAESSSKKPVVDKTDKKGFEPGVWADNFDQAYKQYIRNYSGIPNNVINAIPLENG